MPTRDQPTASANEPRRRRQRQEILDLAEAGKFARAADLLLIHLTDFPDDDDLRAIVTAEYAVDRRDGLP